MAEQITLNFEATEFEGYELPTEFFDRVTRSLYNKDGVRIQQKYQAADMGMSPQQFNQKINKTNNTCITLDEAFKHMELYGDTRLLDFMAFKLSARKSREEIEAQIAELQKSLERK